ncbi:MAG: hypothetical protein E7254_08395 [Lachnospiraceae bacterium]|nr:hypothetical protein [Lachnospiraceae bacterium]
MEKRTNMLISKKMVSALLAGVMVVGMVPQTGNALFAAEKSYEESGDGQGDETEIEVPAEEKPILYRQNNKVWFGNYPQAEVVPDESGYTAIDSDKLSEGDLIVSSTLYNELKETTDWDIHGDTVVDGQKYRRESKEKCCYGIAARDKETEVYSWDEEEYHYFKYEPIQWKIYASDDEAIYVVSDKIIENDSFYNENFINNKDGWEASYIRNWLNGYGSDAKGISVGFSGYNFMDIAFSSLEQNAILTSTLRNDDDTQLGTAAYFSNVKDTNETADKIYLLSLTELTKELGRSNYPRISSTYSKARGTVFNANFFITRTIDDNGYPLVWGEDSWASYKGRYFRGICPAMKISKTDVETVDIDSVEEIEKVEFDSNENKYTGPAFEQYNNNEISSPMFWKSTIALTWNCIWMGKYPQSEVDDATKAMLDGLKDSDKWNGDNDINIGSAKYRRVLIESEEGANYRYFVYEPVKWRIISSNGNNALVVADKNIDTIGYLSAEDIVKPWKDNSARYHLNNKFYDLAFNDVEESAILTSHVVDENNSGSNTFDKLYLLSNDEINSPMGLYAGFDNHELIPSFVGRSNKLEETDYSKINSTNLSLTRTPGNTFTNHYPAFSITTAGADNEKGVYYYVKPVMTINLSEKDAYRYAGTVCNTGDDNEIPYGKADNSIMLSIEGIQISTAYEGFRVIYTTYGSVEVAERGMIYGIDNYVNDDDMTLDSCNEYVYHFAATGKGIVGFFPDSNKQVNAMTMKFIKNKKFYEEQMVVRAYAVLYDGTVVYSDVNDFNVFGVADYLYQKSLMSSPKDHNYLYNNILKVVDSNYEEKAYKEDFGF